MQTAALSGRKVEYQLGRGQVPVDVCRPRVWARTQATASDCSGVPEPIDGEATKPIAMSVRSSGGPHSAELDDLAQGKLDAVDLGGRYRLGSLLGTGGMARVFQAEQLALGRPVAVKILDDSREDRHKARRRFVAEARLTAGLRHPNVVDVIDFGSTPEGLTYIVMERLDGEDLRQTIKREGPLGWARVRSLMLQLCAGVAAAHELGVIHRDLKPSNCFLIAGAEGERVKLLDFGIAISTTTIVPGERVTAEQSVVGTPEYMSPEQARGDEVDARTDIYSLGVILGELLTGRVPFTGRSASGVIAAQIYEPVPSLRALAGRAEVDADIEALYLRAMSKDPADRFASVRELAAAIAAIPAERELAARGAIRHAASLGLFAEGGVAESSQYPDTASFRLLALAENPGAGRRAGLQHGLLVPRPASTWSRVMRVLSMAAALVATGLGVGMFVGHQPDAGPDACELGHTDLPAPAGHRKSPRAASLGLFAEGGVAESS